MSYGLVCLSCRQYLAACSCPWPVPSENARTPLVAENDGRVDRAVIAKMVERELEARQQAEMEERLPRAERRRLMRSRGLP